MSWNYSGNPALNPRDKVRFVLGDTIQTPQSLTDEEIEYLLTQGTVEYATIEAAHAMGQRYAGLSATSKKVGDLSLSVDYGATAARFTALADRLLKVSTRNVMFIPALADTSAATFSMGMDDHA